MSAPADLALRLATPADAARLAAFATRTFEDTFGVDNTPEELALHLAHAYGPAQQRAEIEDRDVRTLLVESEGTLAAYAQVRRGPPPPCVTGPDPVEIWRFYVDRAWHGRGVAGTTMAAALREAEGLGGRTVWLGVWEKNARAIRFYQRNGFEDVGSQVYVVGRDAQTDRVMQRLPRAASSPP